MRSQFMVSMAFLNGDAGEASDGAISGWLKLAAYCARKLNGGRIRSCRAWATEQWLLAVRVRLGQVDAAVAEALAMWDGDDLLLRGYDLVGEGVYLARARVTQAINDRRRAKRQRWTDGAPPAAAPANPTPPGATGNTSHRPQSPSTVTVHSHCPTVTVDGERSQSPNTPPRGGDSDCPTVTVDGDCENRQSLSSTSTTVNGDSSMLLDIEAAAAASERGTPPPPPPPDDGAAPPGSDDPLDRLLRRHGCAVSDPETGEDLRPAWRGVLVDLDAAGQALVFARGPTAVGHGLRFPSGFLQARKALAAPLAELDRAARDDALVERDRDQRRPLVDADADRRAACAAADAACAAGWDRLEAHVLGLPESGYESLIAGCGEPRWVASTLRALRSRAHRSRTALVLEAVRRAWPELAPVIDGEPVRDVAVS